MEKINTPTSNAYSKRNPGRPNGVNYKTHTIRSKNAMPILPKKSHGKSYTSNNKMRLANFRQKTSIMNTMPVQKKKKPHSRNSKKVVNTPKQGYLQKKFGKGAKSRPSNSKKGRENSRRSIDNIYKRSQSTKQNKQENETIYQNQMNAKKKKYMTEQVEKKEDEGVEQRVRGKGFMGNREEGFENIYEKQQQASRRKESLREDQPAEQVQYQAKVENKFDQLMRGSSSKVSESKRKSKGSSKSLGNFNDLLFQLKEGEGKKRNFSRSGKGRINEAIPTNSQKKSIYLKKIPSNKNMKEIYINKLKLINNDLKLSLQKTKEESLKSSTFKADEILVESEKQEGLVKSEVVDFHPKRVVSEMVSDLKNEGDFQDSPLLSKKVRPEKAKEKEALRLSSHLQKSNFKNRNSQKIKKVEIGKKKQTELPLLRNKHKKSGKESKQKMRMSQKLKTNEKKNKHVKTLFSQKQGSQNLVQTNNSSKIKSEKQTTKPFSKKPTNLRQYGKTKKKTTTGNANLNSKKTGKVAENGGTKNSGEKGEGKAPGDEEKPPNKPQVKMEKGHYLKDHPSATKNKQNEAKSKVKIKRSGNGLTSKKKASQLTGKTEGTKTNNLTSLNKLPDLKVNEKRSQNMFEPERALKKKVAKKKNFSLNLDTFKNKIKKDYNTQVEKILGNSDKLTNPRKQSKNFQTEKARVKNITSNMNNAEESDSDSEGGDFDYARGDSMEQNHLDSSGQNDPQKKQSGVKIKASSKQVNSQNGVRKSGTLGTKGKGVNSKNRGDDSKRKKSRGRESLNNGMMSLNYKNHLKQIEKNKQEFASKKASISLKEKTRRNTSIKDFVKKKKQNLSISMNKRGTMNTTGLRKKSNEPMASRKKNQSINPGNRFIAMEKIERKRAVSETHSVSDISFTNLEKMGLRKTKNIVEYIKQREHTLPPFTKARSVVKDFGIIKGFIVNTHKGCVRASNEDRVSILLNAQHKFRKSMRKMNNCAMFSVFDGHGGTDCCNFLKENLHNKILADLDIHKDFDNSMKKIFSEVDSTYLKRAIKKKQNYSGSCANCLFVLDEEVVVVNTGDSRTICSKNKGQEVVAMSIDHKPSCFNEFSRVINNGGQLYRVSSNLKTIENMFYTVTNYSDVLQIDEIENTNKNLCFGPWRIKPGGLSVSR